MAINYQDAKQRMQDNMNQTFEINTEGLQKEQEKEQNQDQNVVYKRENYSNDFVKSELKSQNYFYKDYEQRWGKKQQEVFLERVVVQPMEGLEAKAEVQLVNADLGYFKKVRRAGLAKTKVAAYNQALAKVFKTKKEREKYGFGVADKTRGYALDLMRGTIFWGAIEKKKTEIQRSLANQLNEKNKTLFNNYSSEILALAPPLEIEHRYNNMDEIPDPDQIQFTQESVEAYTKYISDVINDPVMALKTAILDEVHSFDRIPLNMLKKHATAQYFDKVKQLRDKYAAIHMLKSRAKNGAESEMDKMLNELFKNKESGILSSNNALTGDNDIEEDEKEGALSEDQSAHLENMYNALDSDLKYSLEYYGVKYNNKSGIVAKKKKDAAHVIDGDGNATYAYLTAVAEGVKERGSSKNEEYWQKEIENEIKTLPLTEEISDDKFSIIKTTNQIQEYALAQNEKRKGIIDRLSENNRMIASAIIDMERNINRLEALFGNNDGEGEAQVKRRDALAKIKKRPGLEFRMKKQLNDFKQQQINLMNRAQGYIFALRSVADGSELTPLARTILEELTVNEMDEKQKKQLFDELNRNKKENEEDIDGDDWVILETKKNYVDDTLRTRNLPNFVNSAETGTENGLVKRRQHVLKSLRKANIIKNDQEAEEWENWLKSNAGELAIHVLETKGNDIMNMDATALKDAFDKYRVKENEDPEVVETRLIDDTREALKSRMAYINDAINSLNLATLTLEDKTPEELSKIYREVGMLAGKINALRQLENQKIIVNEDGVEQNMTMKDQIEKMVPQEDQVRYKQLRKEFEIKCNLLMDVFNVYRLELIKDAFENDASLSKFYTDEENAKISEILKNVKVKKGAYVDGKNPTALVLKFFTDKLEAGKVLREKRIQELSELTKNIYTGNDQVLKNSRYKKKATNKKNLDTILNIDLEEIKEEENAQKSLYEERRKLINGEGENWERKEKKEEKKPKQKEKKNEDRILNYENIKIVRGDDIDLYHELKKYIPKNDDPLYQNIYTEEPVVKNEEFDEEYINKCTKYEDTQENVLEEGSIKKVLWDALNCKTAIELENARQNMQKGEDDDDLTKEENFKKKIMRGFYNHAHTNLSNLAPDDEMFNRDGVDIEISKEDEAIKWFLYMLSQQQNLGDIAKIKAMWKDKKKIQLKDNKHIDARVYDKVLGIMEAYESAYDTAVRARTEQIQKKALNDYHEDVKNINIRKDNEEHLVFDEKQKGSNYCFVAAFTYCANYYKKLHNIDGEPFTQEKLHDPKNLVVNPNVLKQVKKHVSQDNIGLLDNENYKDEEDYKQYKQNKLAIRGIVGNIRSYDEEFNNQKDFMTNDKVGSPKALFDQLFQNVPNTAIRHRVFDGTRLGELTEEQKPKLANYMLNMIAADLERTKAPVIVWRGSHYLSIVGVDAQSKQFKVLNSSRGNDKPDEEQNLDPLSLINAKKTEFFTLENIESEKLDAIKQEFNLPEGLYKEEGDMDLQKEEVKKAEFNMLGDTNNMFQNLSVGFESPKNIENLGDVFFSNTIFMPKKKNFKAKKDDNNE